MHSALTIQFIFIFFIVQNTTSKPYITHTDLPEYQEYKRRNLLARLNPSTNAPSFTVEFVRNTSAEMDPYEHSVHLPSPCKEIKTADGLTLNNAYCVALLALWFMLMLSAILYQLRTVLSLKNIITSIKKEKAEREEGAGEGGNAGNEHKSDKSNSKSKSADQKAFYWDVPDRSPAPDGADIELTVQHGDQP